MAPLSEATTRLSQIADEVARTHDRVQTTRNGREHVVLTAAADLESMEATIEPLADPEAQEPMLRGAADDQGAPAHDDDVHGLVLAPSARRSVDGLPADVVLAAFELVDGPLRRRPRVVGAPLGAPFEGFWRARRGEHRVRYRVDERRRVVEVVSIDHRPDACRS